MAFCVWLSDVADDSHRGLVLCFGHVGDELEELLHGLHLLLALHESEAFFFGGHVFVGDEVVHVFAEVSHAGQCLCSPLKRGVRGAKGRFSGWDATDDSAHDRTSHG